MTTSASTRRARPRAEHIGSLLRPARLTAVTNEVHGHKAGHSAMQVGLTDQQRQQLRAVEDEAIADAVRRQIDCGLDVVTDGEFRRELFVNSFYDAVEGLRPASARHSRSWKNTRGEEISYPGPPVIERRLTKADSPAAREASYVASLTDVPVKATFPAGSWFVSPLARQADREIAGYRDDEEFQTHVLEILRELIRDAIDAGARYIQLDFPPYVFLVDQNARASLENSGLDTAAFLERCLWADRFVVDGMPKGITFGLHLCRGNYRSSWQFEGAIDPIAEQLFALPYDTFLVEWDDQKRDGDFSALRYLPRGPIAVVGAVTTKTNEMETEAQLLRTIEQAAEHVDVDQLALSPQCGFASARDGNLIDEDHQWRKLELVARVADQVWPR